MRHESGKHDILALRGGLVGDFMRSSASASG